MRAGVRERLAPGTVWRFRRGGHFPYVARAEPYAAAVAEALGLGPSGAELWGGGPVRTA